MALDNIFVTYSMIAVTVLFVIDARSLLPGGKYSRLGFSALLGIFVCSVIYGQITDAVPVSSTIATGAPILAFWMLRGMRRFFIEKYGRPPIDTFLDYSGGLYPDRAFNIMAAFGPFFLSAVVYGLLYVLFVRN